MADKPRGMPLHTKILIGLALGAIGGITARELSTRGLMGINATNLKGFNDNIAKPAGDIFLGFLFMIVVPLIFAALVNGMQELGQAKRFGRVGGLSILLTLGFSLIACTFAIVGTNLFKPGSSLPPAERERIITSYQSDAEGKKQIERAEKGVENPPVLGIIPKNPFLEMTRALEGGLLPIMFFALVFGAALASLPAEQAAPLRLFFESLFLVSQRVIDFAMHIAPYAVFFLVFKSLAELGWDLLFAVSKYALLVIGLLALHLFGTYSLALKFIAKQSPIDFFRRIKVVMLTAFATSSSNATLPLALETADEKLDLPKDISHFVLTVGATANQNGTALYEGVTVLFLAQLFGKDLAMADQIKVLLLTVVASIGTAGIPSASLPFIAVLLSQLGIPAALIGIILGIDRILDMSRTVLNVAGDLTIASCVSALAKRKEPAPAL
ncbi:dicarboxylate/amino acid:cation symporter [bacterium]|nr:MAG: dicarboxylate/amino acid:cation symporter [bacterium]